MAYNVVEITLEYGSCSTWANGDAKKSGYSYKDQNCTIEFTLEKEIPGRLYLYYQLDNYYQNYRKYVTSMSYPQIKGSNTVDFSALKTCHPLVNASTHIFYPCGTLPETNFLDDIDLKIHNKNGEPVYSFSSDSIDLRCDREQFKVPKYADNSTIIPGAWRSKFKSKNWDKMSYSDQVKFIANDPHLHVWMRTAPFPSFRKLYGIGTGDGGLPAGTYRISVQEWSFLEKYDVKKSLFLTNLSPLGVKNYVLAIAYIVMGSILILTAILLFIIHWMHPRQIGDCNYLSWNQERAEADKTTQILYKIFSTADD